MARTSHRLLSGLALALLGANTMGCPARNTAQTGSAAPAVSSAPTASAAPAGSAAPTPTGSAAKGTANPCYAVEEPSDMQRYKWQEAFDAGKDPCPGWYAPTVTLDESQGLSLNGEVLLPAGKLPTKELTRIEPLFKRLIMYKNRFASFDLDRKRRFDGTLVIKATSKISAAAGFSALLAAQVRYLTVKLETPAKTLELATWSPASRDTFMLYVEPVSGDEVVAGSVSAILPGKDKATLVEKQRLKLSSLDFKKLAKLVCATNHTVEGKSREGMVVSKCPLSLLFRASDGTFEDALRPLSIVHEALKAVGPKSLGTRVEFKCNGVPSLGRVGITSELRIAPEPWGPREPQEPCF